MCTNLSTKIKAAFIDRDGVINDERNYVHRIEDFTLLPGVAKGLGLLRNAGFLLIVITNQSGIARGFYNEKTLQILHDHMVNQLAELRVVLDAIYFCPHHPTGSVKELACHCDCRKPSPGMLFQAAKDFSLNLPASVLIGDKISDLQAGRRAGVGRVVLVESGHQIDSASRKEADAVVSNLLAAAQLLTAK